VSSDIRDPDLNEHGEPKTREERALEQEPSFLERLMQRAKNKADDLAEIEITRGGETILMFRVHPLTESQVNECRNQATRWERRKEMGYLRVPAEIDGAKFRSLMVYEATVPEDRKQYWDNRQLQEAYGALTVTQLIDEVLLAGGKDQAVAIIEKISGFQTDLEDLVPN